jgi:hypothetical protein
MLCTVSALLMLSVPAMASTEFNPGGTPSYEGSLQIATDGNPNADGYLSISPDAFGSWTAATWGGAGDLFNPAGAEIQSPVAFSSGLFVFVPSLTQREVLTINPTWQGVFPADASLDAIITSPSVASDTDGNFVDDTLESSFTVGGGSTALSFDLTQTVAPHVAGISSFLVQKYVITNDASTPIDFTLVRAMDADLLWGPADFADDEVGTTTNGAGLGPYVFQQEPFAPGTTSVTLSGLSGGNYYGGKHGVEPAGGPPPYNFGTDVDVWDAYGVPTSWESHVAGVGYFTNGLSGSNPPGSTSPEDGFIGLDFPVSLGPGEQISVTIVHTYGQNEPVEVPPDGDGGGDGGDGGGGGVPATSTWGVIALFALLMGVSLYFMRRRSSARA